MYRYFIELAYNGKAFNGWQAQPLAPSVQQEFNKDLSLLLREPIRVTGAGRTDTGVHASFFTAHFDTLCPISSPEGLKGKLNRFLGRDIYVFDIYRVKEDAHARFSALSRTYKYYVGKRKNPFNYDFTFITYPLPEVEKMNEACKILFEFTDFTSFSKLHTDVKTNNCRILEAGWEDTAEHLIFTIKADRFLRNMVRAIVGTLLEVGQNKITPEEFRQIIASKDRSRAGNSVPGHALFLHAIAYPDNLKYKMPI